MNIFEQQANLEKQFRDVFSADHQEQSPALALMHLLDKPNLERYMAAMMLIRDGLKILAMKATTSQAASNLEEAAEFANGILINCRGAMNSKQEDEDYLCSACNGSGEGQQDGNNCRMCKGTGSERELVK